MKRFSENSKVKENLFSHYRNSRAIKIWDILLILIILSIVVASIVVITTREKGNYCEVYYDGELIGSYTLEQELIVRLDEEGKIIIHINNGSVAIIENNCKNHICIDTGYISNVGERIVCAPHRIIVAVKSTQDKNKHYVTGGNKWITLV